MYVERVFEGIYLRNICDQMLIWRSIQGILNKEIPLGSFTNTFKSKRQARMIFLRSRALTSHGLQYDNY